MQHAGAGRGVLVVDDSEEYLAVVCSWIDSQPGLTLVGTARNGAEALEAVSRLAPDLVIIDSFMPVMDGFAATRAIKTRPCAPTVVMVSIHDGSGIEHEAWAAGADAFVVKANLAVQLPSVLQGLSPGPESSSRPARPAPHSKPEGTIEP